MRFKHSVQVAIDNFSNVFILLLYRVISWALFFSVGYVILRYGLEVVVRSVEADRILALLKGFPAALFSGDTATLQTFRNDFQNALYDFGVMLGGHSGAIIGATVGIGILHLLSRFVNGLADFAVGNTLNDRMAACARTRFSASFFRNIGRASLYQVLYVPISFVYDALCIAACWFLFFYAPNFVISDVLGILLALALTVTAVVLLQALKLTLFSSWMPAIIAGNSGVGAAFAGCFTKGKGFARRFAGFLVTCYLILAVNAVFALCTFGSAVIFTIPVSYFFVLCMKFVNYYDSEERQYFLSRDTIAGAGDRLN